MSESSPAPEWGTIATAAERFAFSVDTVRRMISRGEIEAVRLGPKLVRVNLTSVLAGGRPVGSFEDAS